MLKRWLSSREIRKLVAAWFEADPSLIGAPRSMKLGMPAARVDVHSARRGS